MSRIIMEQTASSKLHAAWSTPEYDDENGIWSTTHSNGSRVDLVIDGSYGEGSDLIAAWSADGNEIDADPTAEALLIDAARRGVP